MDDVPEKVHEVAEALRAECRKQYGTDWNFDVSWAFARAAIEAMREPTEAMIDAGVVAETGQTLGARVAHSHRAMIDAALVTTPSKL